MFGYRFHIINCNPAPIGEKETLRTMFERQVHDVPIDVFLRFWWSFEDDPREVAADTVAWLQ